MGSILGLVAGGASKIFGLAEGGAIPTEASPSKGAIPDDIPAAVSAGEFVIPADAVRWHGEKTFYGLVEKAETERAERQQALPV